MGRTPKRSNVGALDIQGQQLQINQLKGTPPVSQSECPNLTNVYLCKCSSV